MVEYAGSLRRRPFIQYFHPAIYLTSTISFTCPCLCVTLQGMIKHAQLCKFISVRQVHKYCIYMLFSSILKKLQTENPPKTVLISFDEVFSTGSKFHYISPFSRSHMSIHLLNLQWKTARQIIHPSMAPNLS